MDALPLPQVSEKYRTYIEKNLWGEYLASLCHDGLSWWFTMDTPSIAAHLMALPPLKPPGIQL